MAEPIGAQRGTRDILPPEIQAWQLMEAIARDAFSRYDFAEIRIPAFEATELFARGIGGETDIVGKEMYTFTDRGGRQISLRPEGTAGVVRAYLEHKLYAGPLPLKVWYQGPMFRYERPQKGRQRQFHQIGVEVFGSAEPTADAEAIALARDFYQGLFEEISRRRPGADLPELVVQINTLGDDRCRPAYRVSLQEYFRSHASGYCEDCQRRMETNPLRVLDCKVPSCEMLNGAAPTLEPCPDCQVHFDAVRELLSAAEVPFEWNARLVRGLDYYTRTVFEIVPRGASKFGQSTVCAGGRYDRLVSDLGGPPTPAFGWALGQERVADLVLAALDDTSATEAGLPLAVGPLAPEATVQAFQLALQLRRRGLAVALLPQASKPDKHLKAAVRLGAHYLALLGADELARGEVTLRDLHARQQQSVAASAAALSAAMAGPQPAPAAP